MSFEVHLRCTASGISRKQNCWKPFREGMFMSGIIPHKETPTLDLNRQYIEKYPDSIQFTTWQGQVSTPEALTAKIKENVRTAELSARPENVGKKWIKG